MRKLLIGGLLLIALYGAMAWPSSSINPSITADVLTVYDGDTILVEIEDMNQDVEDLHLGEVTSVRYLGIDAPETGDTPAGVEPNPMECFADEATDFNRSLVQGRTVYLELDQQVWGSHDRLLSYVYEDPEGQDMVNTKLASQGYAPEQTIAPNDRYEQEFNAAERDAINADLGLWDECAVHWEQASNHFQRRMVISGVVESTGTNQSGDVFLNLGNPYPSTPRFTVVIYETKRPYNQKCRDALQRRHGDIEEKFGEKRISVYGEIVKHEGIPQIELCDPDHIWAP